MTSQEIERAAAYYARATAIRAIHGLLPEPDAIADAKVWAKTVPSIQAEMIKMVEAIFAAAHPQSKPEPYAETCFDRAAKMGCSAIGDRSVREG